MSLNYTELDEWYSLKQINETQLKEWYKKESFQQFSDNLASDIAPLLSLFGDHVAKQYMSTMTGWADSIIFAMAPLGIITGIVSAIRVGGPTWLKNVIGRARENKAAPEVELMSSTSSEVCELWNGQQLVRVMGRPQIAQLVYLPSPTVSNDVSSGTHNQAPLEKGGATASVAARTSEVASPGSPLSNQTLEGFHRGCELYTLRDAVGLGHLGSVSKHTRAKNSAIPSESTAMDTSDFKDAELEISATDSTDRKTRSAPNISLNLYDHISRVELYIVAIVGVLLQAGVLAYVLTIEYHGPLRTKLEKEEFVIPEYTAVLTVVGTVVMTIGLLLCSHVVETSTTETRYFRFFGSNPVSSPELYPRILWLQREERVNDQAFDSYAIFARGHHKSVLTSTRRDAYRRTFMGHEYSMLKAMTVVATLTSIAGFIIQFTGIRAMNFTVAVAQLAATIVMTVLRAFVRRRLSTKPHVQKVPENYEIEWLATRVAKDDEGKVPEQLSKPWDETESFTDLDKSSFWSEDAYDLDFQDYLFNQKHLDRLSRVVAARKTLYHTIKIEDNWKSPTEELSKVVLKSINSVLNSKIFTGACTNDDVFTWTIPGLPNVEFKAEKGEDGVWEAVEADIDAVLSLWAYSVESKERRLGCSDKANPLPYLWILGESTESLKRDLQWWGNENIPSLYEYTPVDRDHDQAQYHYNHCLIGNVQTLPGNDYVASFINSETLSSDAEFIIPSKWAEDGSDYVQSNVSERRYLVTRKNSKEPEVSYNYGLALFQYFLEYISSLETMNRIQGRVTVSRGRKSGSAWDSIHLKHPIISQVVMDVENAGLATSESIWLAVIAPLSRGNKLPDAGALEDIGIQEVWEHVAHLQWQEAVDTLIKLFRIVRTYHEDDVISIRVTAVVLEIMMIFDKNIKSGLHPKEKVEEFRNGFQRLRTALKRSAQHGNGKTVRALVRILKAQSRPVLYDMLSSDWEPSEISMGLDAVSTSKYEQFNSEQEDRYWQALYPGLPSWFIRIARGQDITKNSINPTVDNVNITDAFGFTALHYATNVKSWKRIMEILLDKGARPNIQSAAGYTPLHCAAMSDFCDVEKTKLLVKSGAQISVKTRDGLQPLHIAAMLGKNRLLRDILRNVDATDIFGRTALHYAAQFGKISSIELLRSSHAKINVKDYYFRTPFHFSVIKGKIECCKFLIKEGAEHDDVDYSRETALHFASRFEDDSKCQMLKYLLELGLDPTAAAEGFYRPIHCAAEQNNVAAIDTLLSASADGRKMLDAMDDCWRTPLHYAVRQNNLEAARFLFDQGASVLAEDIDHLTPFDMATTPEMLTLLFAHIDREDCSRVAIQSKVLKDVAMNNKELLHHLITTGINIRQVPESNAMFYDEKEPLLHYAARKDDIYLAEQILQRMTDLSGIDIQDDYGRTPLYTAATRGSINVANFLLHLGASVKAVLRTPDADGNTILHYICINPFNETIFDALLQKPGTVSALEIRNNDGYTPLLFAAASDDSDSLPALRYLLSKGANPRAVVEGPIGGAHHGAPALLLIIHNNETPETKLEKLKILLSYQASRPLQSLATALSAARARGLEEIVKILEQEPGARVHSPRRVPAPVPVSGIRHAFTAGSSSSTALGGRNFSRTMTGFEGAYTSTYTSFGDASMQSSIHTQSGTTGSASSNVQEARRGHSSRQGVDSADAGSSRDVGGRRSQTWR